MGYYVRKLMTRKKSPHWKVQYVLCKRKDQKPNSKAQQPKRTWDISKERWRALGFNLAMSFEEASVRARQLNSQLLIRRQEERIKEIFDKQNAFLLKNEASFPDEFVAEFEERFIRVRGILSEDQRKIRNRQRYVKWKAAQRAVVAVGLEPTNWFFHADHFYDHFVQQRYSCGYVQSILSMINLWGHFITRKLGQPYSPILRPRGYERLRILEASYQKEKRRLPSGPITPEDLALMRDKVKPPNFNWLYISVWFGLRPQEIDQLKNPEMWKIETLPTGRKVLWVYQTKIIALPPEDRWKPIPLIFDEQHFALKIATDGNFKRPLTKTIRKHLGSGVDCYGGRKGFVDLMLSNGQAMENISIWMGHATLGRTWRSYKNKKVFHL